MKRPKRMKGGRRHVTLRCRSGIWVAAGLLRINRSEVLERALQAETRRLLYALHKLAKEYKSTGREEEAARLRAVIERVRLVRDQDRQGGGA